MSVNDASFHSSMFKRKEKVDAVLIRLKSLKWRISELRAQCEAFKLESEKQVSFTCNECGKLIEQDDEITLKDSFGNLKSRYHKECFKAIWFSRNRWFDNSSSSLQLSGKDQ